MSGALRRFWVSTSLLTLVVALAAPAGARKFQMSGSWIVRWGSLFWPFQFARSLQTQQPPIRVWVSMGNLTGGIGFPNGPAQGMGGVTATGSAPAALRVPKGRFGGHYSTRVPFWCGGNTTLAQIATMATVSAPHTPATLAAGGGPGSFTWCPGDPACVAKAPPAKRATDPPQGAGARNGRVIYRAGANRFGGVMQMLLGGGGIASREFRFPDTQLVHQYFGPRGSLAPTGGPYAAARVRQEPPSVVTQPTMALGCPPVVHPGPKVTTMGGLTTMAAGPPITFPGSRITATGFPFTTGTVFAQQTMGTGGQDFFTVMGSDARTALGAGNLGLVAGGLSLRTRAYPSLHSTPFASFGKVRMTLSAPVPSLSPSGVAAAAALVLLAAGCALRGRIRGAE
jgi:hypothetical protein